MRVMVTVKDTRESEAGQLPDTERPTAIGRFNEEQVQAGELVAGFCLWQVKSMDEAVHWVQRCPDPMRGASEIEIRPILEAEDLRAELMPELRVQEDRPRAEIEAAARQPR